MPPKLLGVFELPFHRMTEVAGGQPRELIKRVGIDEHGQQWGLVERATPIADLSGGARAMRMDCVRWIRFEAIPFYPDEVVTAEKWLARGPVQLEHRDAGDADDDEDAPEDVDN